MAAGSHLASTSKSPIPCANEALIAEEKLRDYLLSTEHPVGRYKARFFARLGYAAERWRQLERDLREQHLRLPADEAEPSEFGRIYRIRAILRGPLGSAVVVSIWIVRRGERTPRFVTAFPGDGP